MKNVVMYIASALVLTALWGCASPKVLLSEKEASGKASLLKVGENARVTVTENPTTGYLWYSTVKGDTLKITRNDYVPPEGTLCGAPGVRQITVKAQKTGKGELLLQSRRPWIAPSKEDKQLVYTFEIR